MWRRRNDGQDTVDNYKNVLSRMISDNEGKRVNLNPLNTNVVFHLSYNIQDFSSTFITINMLVESGSKMNPKYKISLFRSISLLSE